MPTQRISYDLNIEFAHIAADSRLADNSFEKSYELLLSYTNACHSRNERFSLSILIDDKESDLVESHAWLVRKLREVQFVHWDVLCWGIESELQNYRVAICRMLADDQGLNVSRRIDLYYRKHGRLACSHDIAIWHLLRLGVIEWDQKCGLRTAEFERPDRKFRVLPAKRVVSILSDEDLGPERRAEEELLRQIGGQRHILGRIDRAYYSVR